MEQESNIYVTVVFDIQKSQYGELVNQALKLGAVTIEKEDIIERKNELDERLSRYVAQLELSGYEFPL